MLLLLLLLLLLQLVLQLLVQKYERVGVLLVVYGCLLQVLREHVACFCVGERSLWCLVVVVVVIDLMKLFGG
jgi:hypothetical protein